MEALKRFQKAEEKYNQEKELFLSGLFSDIIKKSEPKVARKVENSKFLFIVDFKNLGAWGVENYLNTSGTPRSHEQKWAEFLINKLRSAVDIHRTLCQIIKAKNVNVGAFVHRDLFKSNHKQPELFSSASGIYRKPPLLILKRIEEVVGDTYVEPEYTGQMKTARATMIKKQLNGRY